LIADADEEEFEDYANDNIDLEINNIKKEQEN
jgi:hypothetical protein